MSIQWRCLGLLGILVGTSVALDSFGLKGIADGSAAIAQTTLDSPQQILLKDGPLPIPSRQEITKIPPSEKFPLPAARVPSEGNIYLVNYTNARIDYAVLGLTGESLLRGLLEAPERSAVELPQLQRPINLSIRRQDSGFILVRSLVQDGNLYLIMDFSPSIQLDTTYINIKADGEVYLY
ncbi:MAG: hypothetical protein AAF889_09175 [Cyanobacteria bacterium P01_D01_bin.73]